MFNEGFATVPVRNANIVSLREGSWIRGFKAPAPASAASDASDGLHRCGSIEYALDESSNSVPAKRQRLQGSVSPSSNGTSNGTASGKASSSAAAAEAKRMKRVMANRRSAKESRERRKRHVAALEETLVTLQAQQGDLERENRTLRAQVEVLTQQLQLNQSAAFAPTPALQNQNQMLLLQRAQQQQASVATAVPTSTIHNGAVLPALLARGNNSAAPATPTIPPTITTAAALAPAIPPVPPAAAPPAAGALSALLTHSAAGTASQVQGSNGNNNRSVLASLLADAQRQMP